GDFTVVISHVNFELPRRAPPLPPVVGVPHSEITLGRRITDSARRHKLHPQEAKEQSTEMSENRNSTLRWLKNRNDRDHDPNADQILGLDPEGQRKQKHFLVGVQNPKGHQQSEDAARRAHCFGTRIHPQEMGIRDSNCHHSGAHDAKRVALDESSRPPPPPPSPQPPPAQTHPPHTRTTPRRPERPNTRPPS